MPLRNRWLIGAGAAAAAVAAAFAVDHPVERWVSGHRTAGATSFFRAATNLGSPGPAFVLGLVLAAFAAFRSVRVAGAVLVVTLARPLVSTLIKELTDRQRPQLSALVPAAGQSFPSGHTLAATVVWGCLPAVMLAWRAGRDLVQPAVALAVLVVVTVAASRVYLGVHWVSDVVGGAVLGGLLLVVVLRELRRP